MPEAFDLAHAPLPVHPEIAGLLARNPDIEARVYRDGEFLVREDEESQEIFVLLAGGLVVERAPALAGAPAIPLACLTAEEGLAIVGEMAYLGALRRTASVRSSGMSRVLCLRPAHIDLIIAGCPMLTRIICRQFSHRLQETLQALSRLQARFILNPARRVAQEGEILFRRGEAAGDLCQLLAGAVRLERDGGVETVSAESLPHGFLEPEAYLASHPHAATATVEGMAFLTVLGEGDREAVVRSFPDLALEILRKG